MRKLLTASALALTLGSLVATAAPAAAQYRQEISNDMRQCAGNNGPAIKVTVHGIRAGSGVVRVQSYRATNADWMAKGRWINRIEAPARAASMTFCVPLPDAGTYGIAVRHDVNGNGKTDISRDGGAMSNNPSINILNLGKPSYKKVGVAVNNGVTPITINMRYM
ncbi:hypothetical protein NT2_04_01920 [Caenibius tardaugens NBRC 16725]|uniref:DUF2141 domain-containing protein n=1 Tax=Caenibius tardaugens NBRC 16725 TaxID=1219035 RepID=U2YJX8_9SPHN|nr:DUF2141 domain-containing protein [Caenibius tardaugens]AZI36135.1 DUF2141 domain-containing protein [Caenibius tardaugens NBRC 16725]GAD48780.1 hypothetical protein NT2_04_01920 [Caenibius tardaugens NBRC 16725]